MPFILDLNSGIPIYIQLKNAIKAAVASGEYPPGSRLPTVRQLAVDLKINPNTVSRVYSELEQEGLLETKQGRGTSVRGNPEKAGDAQSQLNLLIEAMLSEAARLGFPPKQVLKAVEKRVNK